MAGLLIHLNGTIRLKKNSNKSPTAPKPKLLSGQTKVQPSRHQQPGLVMPFDSLHCID